METLEYLRNRITVITGVTPEDDLLNTCIDDAQRFIKGYCGIDTIPEPLVGIERKLALISYNTLGIEGFGSYSEAGTSISIKNLTKYELSIMNRYRDVIVG